MSGWLAWTAIAALAVTGIYILLAPRRLFMRPDEPASYRPEAVEYDSAHGVWLRKTAGPMFIVIALVLALVRIF